MNHQYLSLLFIGLLLGLGSIVPGLSFEEEILEPDAIKRVSPEEARAKTLAGIAILVCAYNDQRCKGQMLDGALTRREFEQKMQSLSKDQEIITYCS